MKNPACVKAFTQINNELNNINPYDVYRWCWHEKGLDSAPNANPREGAKTPWASWAPFRDNPDGIPCVDVRGSTYYWNQDGNREAFNVQVPTADLHWSTCVNVKSQLQYDLYPGHSQQWYPDLIKSGIRIQIYSGDTDSTVPFVGTRQWFHNVVEAMKLEKTTAWKEWSVGG